MGVYCTYIMSVSVVLSQSSNLNDFGYAEYLNLHLSKLIDFTVAI